MWDVDLRRAMKRAMRHSYASSEENPRSGLKIERPSGAEERAFHDRNATCHRPVGSRCDAGEVSRLVDEVSDIARTLRWPYKILADGDLCGIFVMPHRECETLMPVLDRNMDGKTDWTI
jgi:hypothetical protein